MNKTCNNAAEFMERRVSTKGNSQQHDRSQTQSWNNTTLRLLAVRNAARTDKKRQFTNLYHQADSTLKCITTKQPEPLCVQPLSGTIQVDDAYYGGEHRGGKRGRGSENKTPFIAAVSTRQRLNVSIFLL